MHRCAASSMGLDQRSQLLLYQQQCHWRLLLQRPMPMQLPINKYASMHIQLAPCGTLLSRRCLLPLLYCSPTTATTSVALLSAFDGPPPDPTPTLTLSTVSFGFNCSKSPSSVFVDNSMIGNPGAGNICSDLPAGATAFVVWTSNYPFIGVSTVQWFCLYRNNPVLGLNTTPYPSLPGAVQILLNAGEEVTCVALITGPTSPTLISPNVNSPSPSPTDPSPR
jgi:hypothetical protein